MNSLKKNLLLLGLAAVCLPSTTVNAFDYNISSAGSLVLTDNSTGISEIITMFKNDVTLVSVDGVAWDYTGLEGGESLVTYTTIANGVVQDEGAIDISDTTRELPTSFDVGSVQVGKSKSSSFRLSRIVLSTIFNSISTASNLVFLFPRRSPLLLPSGGTATIEVILSIDGNTVSTDGKYQVYAAGVSIIPLIWILFLAMLTQMVELTLFTGIWLGSCIVYGSLAEGFRQVIVNYLVGALADGDRVSVILFTVFLSGAVGMMQKSGGMLGFTRDIARIARTPRSGQFACFTVGVIIFFDDYSNVLLAGQTMRPLTDLLSVSREKLSFVVDATSAPIASIAP